MKIYSSAILSFLACLSRAAALLESNEPENPQDLTQIVCANRPREKCAVELDVPQACAGQQLACPIVFFLHGSGGTNKWFSRTSKVHDAGYIGIYPQGEDGWNTGPKNSNACLWSDFDCTNDPDEGDLVASIITELRIRGAVGNVYVIGNSNGAALAHRLAANAGTDLPIKGIVAKVTQLLSGPERSGPGTLNYNIPSADTSAVSVLSIMGTADGLIPYEGGSSPVFNGVTEFKLMSALESMEFWAKHNGCGDGTSVNTSQHTTDQGTGIATKYVYVGCPSGIIVEHFAINGGGHGAGGATIDSEDIDYVVAYDFIKRVENASGPGGEPTSSPVKNTPAPDGEPTSSPVKNTPAPDGEPTLSPVASPTGSCVNDPGWVGKFNTDHTCDFVAQNPIDRCDWVSSDGVSANEACSAVCNPNCAPCQDSSARFTFKNSGRKKNCKFVSKKNTSKRCEAVSEECPVTCETGCACFDTEGGFLLGKNKKTRTCAWAGSKNKAKRCARNKVRSKCPITCDVC